MKNNARGIYELFEGDEFDGQINDKKLELELLKFSTLPLLYMTEDMQKDIELYQWVVKVDSMAIAWVVFDVRDVEII